jgi:hypothetical protein
MAEQKTSVLAVAPSTSGVGLELYIIEKTSPPRFLVDRRNSMRPEQSSHQVIFTSPWQAFSGLELEEAFIGSRRAAFPLNVNDKPLMVTLKTIEDHSDKLFVSITGIHAELGVSMVILWPADHVDDGTVSSITGIEEALIVLALCAILAIIYIATEDSKKAEVSTDGKAVQVSTQPQ